MVALDEELARVRQVKAATACRLLDIHRSTLDRWMRSGLGPPCQRLPGGGLRFKISDLEAFTENATDRTR